MEALKNNKKVLILFGFYPDGTRGLVKMIRLLFGFTVFFMISQGCISSFIYMKSHILTDMGTSLQATLQVAALSSTVYITILATILRSKILDMIKSYQEIHDKSELNESLGTRLSITLSKKKKNMFTLFAKLNRSKMGFIQVFR